MGAEKGVYILIPMEEKMPAVFAWLLARLGHDSNLEGYL